MRELSEQGVAPKADFDRLDAEYKQAEARVGEINATISRKTIRAPFSGGSGSVRSTSASTWKAEGRSCRSSLWTRSTSTSRCRSSRWAD